MTDDAIRPATDEPKRPVDTDGRPIYIIPLDNMAALRERLDKLNRRAVRLGQPPIVLREVGTSERKITDRDGKRVIRIIPLVHITVEGASPKLNGWTFLATLDHASEAGIIIRAVPGATIPVQYREAMPVCDHCHADRRRHETFIVRHDDGRIAQVGRQCLRDFLGHQSPDAIATYAEFLAAMGEACEAGEDWGEGGGSGSGRIPLDTFLAYVSSSIRRFGWLSRTKAKEWDKSATADLALSTLALVSDGKGKPEDKPTDADWTRAAAAIEWTATLRERNPENLSDYEHNLRVATSGSTCTWRTAGIVASLITTYERALGIEVERKAAAAVSQHVGTPGKRETFKGLVCTKCLHIETQYGVLNINLFKDAAGNVLVWRTGSWDGQVGNVYDLKATVKEHSNYKGIKQTDLARCKVEAETDPNAEQPEPAPGGDLCTTCGKPVDHNEPHTQCEACRER
jgi:hypothetical protein